MDVAPRKSYRVCLPLDQTWRSNRRITSPSTAITRQSVRYAEHAGRSARRLVCELVLPRLERRLSFRPRSGNPIPGRSPACRGWSAGWQKTDCSACRTNGKPYFRQQTAARPLNADLAVAGRSSQRRPCATLLGSEEPAMGFEVARPAGTSCGRTPLTG